LAMKKGFITKDALTEIERYILRIYGHIEVPHHIFEDLITLTRQDKKNEQGHVLFSLLEQVGKANYNITVSDEDMKASLTYYNSLNG
jgi:3-dehydroquinate synthase